MSERLTPHWTNTLEEAFGTSGKRGREGELFLKQVIESWGWEVIDNEEDKDLQVSGKDLLIKNPNWANFYSVDVKNNLDNYGSFYVDLSEKGWLFNPKKKSDRIWHVNTTTGWMSWYGRKEMQEYARTKYGVKEELIKITVHDKIPFVTRRKHEQ
jgi:hypothetical protein